MDKLDDLGGQTYRQTDRPHYKQIKILGVRVYIINGRVKRDKLDNGPNKSYLMGYSDTTVFFLN